ncbi:uncharacterized protein C8A04DRAFT_14828 [Dichotomopilus funicola]|uniref:Uncharacterized protein n=1 Tax=Dichotomopilus funicola TaxID=1934379 RepID=A0AAN6UY05_9PEZI|nr:hypothetical protein C8A04DRAFT_14828 [Dichotomopilus funicola]
MQDPGPKYVSPLATWGTKLGFRATSIVCSIILAGLSGSLAANQQLYSALTLMIVIAPALIITFCWDIAEGVCILKRPGHRGIHPGAIVAVDLLAWLGWLVVDFFLITYELFAYDDYMDRVYDDNGYYRYVPHKLSPQEQAIVNDVHAKGRAMMAFGILITLAHFALFVIGCYETNIRNRMPRTVYVMQPYYAGPAPVQMPASAYQHLAGAGSTPSVNAMGQQQHQPQAYMMQPAAPGVGQMPAQPVPAQLAAPTAGGEGKGGLERFA